MSEIIILIVCATVFLLTLNWFIEGLFKERCDLCYRMRLARHIVWINCGGFGIKKCKPDCLTRSFLNGKWTPDGVIYDYGDL